MMDRLTKKHWGNLDPWECCGQDNYCKRGCHEEGGCTKGCIVPRVYRRLARYEDSGLSPEQVKGLQQEIERLQISYSIQLKANLVQVDENNKLQAQNGAIKEVLGCIQHSGRDCDSGHPECPICRGGDEWHYSDCELAKALSTTGTDYHNPDDVVENDRLKFQNKLMLTALLCLPRVDDATLSPEVCKICAHVNECEDCLIDAAIQEGMCG